MGCTNEYCLFIRHESEKPCNIAVSFTLGVIVVARNPESLVREVLAQHLAIQFTEARSHLGSWGRTDGEATLGDHARLFLEVESMQKHPSTNVLKVWPFLEENKSLSVLLVHAGRIQI